MHTHTHTHMHTHTHTHLQTVFSFLYLRLGGDGVCCSLNVFVFSLPQRSASPNCAETRRAKRTKCAAKTCLVTQSASALRGGMDRSVRISFLSALAANALSVSANYFLNSHMLPFCSALTLVKVQHYTAQSLKMLFRDVSFDSVFHFFKEINSFGKLQVLLLHVMLFCPLSTCFLIDKVLVICRHLWHVLWSDKISLPGCTHHG